MRCCRGRVQRHCLEYYARRADACIVEQLEDAGALLRKEDAGSRFELYLIELTAANPAAGLQAAAQLRQRGVRAPLAFLAHTPAYAYEAFRVDAMQYLQIPFRPEQLTALLDRATEPEYGPVIPVTTSTGPAGPPLCGHRVSGMHPPCGAFPPCQRRGCSLALAAGCPSPKWRSRCWPTDAFCSLTALTWSTWRRRRSCPWGSCGCAAVPASPSPRPRSCREGSLPEVFGTINDRKEVLSNGQGLFLSELQLRPPGQELVADTAEGGFIGGAGGVGDADDVKACVVGGAGRVEGILADGAAVRVGAAKAL